MRWTRDDDIRHDSYRPMSVHRLGATLGPDGVPIGRIHQVVTWPLTVLPPFGNPAVVRASGDHFPYAVPGDVSVTLRPAPLRTGFWRAVYAGQFGYAEECFLSEIARRGGHDQVDLRRRLLPADSRLRRVLDAAAERAGWTRGVAAGLGHGVACHLDYGSAIAVLVTADPAARRVLRVTAAVDVGVPIHPSGVIAQVEGGVLDAVSTVLGAQTTVRGGAVVQSSFRDYAWAPIGDCPDIDVLLVPSEAPIGGLGELAYPPAGAAVALAEGGDPVAGMPYGVPVGWPDRTTCQNARMEGDGHEIARSAEQVRADVDSWPTGRLLSVAARMVESRFDRFLADMDLSHAGLIALHHLVGGPLSQRELAHLCRVTDQTMSRTIDRLARTAHVERTPDGRDRRRTLVAINAKGLDALAAARREERRSEQLLGAVEDYDHFRHQLITLITVAAEPDNRS